MIREILIWPNQRLHEKSVAIPDDEFGELDELIQDMFDTMYDAGGIGLAAIQIGAALRVIVMDVKEQHVFINPKIISMTGGRELKNEGCLSLPGIIEQVERYATVDLEFQDRTGAKFVKRFEGLEAQCIQHEVEHLDGIIIPDKLGPMAKARLASIMAKKRRGV